MRTMSHRQSGRNPYRPLMTGNHTEATDTLSERKATDQNVRVSILVPSYNPGEYLATAIGSALSQLADNDEILVQDGQSTDGSAEYLAKLSEDDARVKIVVEADNGQSDALNRAVARAANPWVIWLNADDILLESSLAALREAVWNSPDVDVVVGGHQVIRADGSVVDHYQGKALEISRIVAKGCAAFSGSIMVRTELLREIGGFATELNTAMDLDLQLRLADTQARQVVIPTPIGALRFHEMSKSANLWMQFVREGHAVRMRYAADSEQKMSGYFATAIHWASLPIFRVRMTPAYRSVRRYVVQHAARLRRGQPAA
jgi:glycosyltransferase involved in cell wall biosynthesis